MPTDPDDQKSDDNLEEDNNLNAISEKLTEKVKKTKEATRFPDVPSQEEVRSRLKLDDPHFQEKRKKAGYDDHSIRNRNQAGNSYHRSFGVGLAVAYNLIGAVLAGWLIGWLIDRATGSIWGITLGPIIGAVVGLVSAVFVILKTPAPPHKK